MDETVSCFCRRACRSARCATYLLAGAAMLSGCAGNACAAVHYYYGNLPVEPRTEQPLDINLEGDDYDDIVLMNFVYPDGNYQGAFIPYAPGSIVGFSVGPTEYVTALEAGAIIGPGTLGLAYEATLAYGAQAPGAQFHRVKDAYVGFAFPIGPTNLHYAWLRVDVDNAAGELLLKDWAYEDRAGVSIVAGDVGTLPIPGDFDRNRRVDGADFLTWQRDVTAYNAFDFQNWRQNFGAGAATSASAGVVVPEPGALGALVSVAAAATACSRKSARRRGRTTNGLHAKAWPSSGTDGRSELCRR